MDEDFFLAKPCFLTKRHNFCESSILELGEFGWIWCVLEQVGVPSFAQLCPVVIFFPCALISALTFLFLTYIIAKFANADRTVFSTSPFARPPRKLKK